MVGDDCISEHFEGVYMESVIVEIRAAEGGADAKDLVKEQLSIYVKMAATNELGIEILESVDGFVMFKAYGENARKFFQNESGGHRWQRIPPTERRGRVHTSTITVAVMSVPNEQQLRLEQRDLDIKTVRGSGPGGQARNKTESCVVITHTPSGVMVRCDSERSQSQNRSTAMEMLRAKLYQTMLGTAKKGEDDLRRNQIGSGQRGDKIRTIRTQDGIVTDHRLNVKIRFSDYERGDFGKIHKSFG